MWCILFIYFFIYFKFLRQNLAVSQTGFEFIMLLLQLSEYYMHGPALLGVYFLITGKPHIFLLLFFWRMGEGVSGHWLYILLLPLGGVYLVPESCLPFYSHQGCSYPSYKGLKTTHLLASGLSSPSLWHTHKRNLNLQQQWYYDVVPTFSSHLYFGCALSPFLG